MAKTAIIKNFIFLIAIFLACCSGTVHNNYDRFIKNYKSIIVYADESFDDKQELLIAEAAKSWERASGLQIKFIIYYNQKRPGTIEEHYKKDRLDRSIFVWNLPEKERLSLSFKFKYEIENLDKSPNDPPSSRPDGLWDKSGNIYILEVSKERFYSVILHEFGHALGINHTTKQIASVMHPNATKPCLTELDTYELCSILGCIPKPECYVLVDRHVDNKTIHK